jgi:hypothetical protein
MIIALIYPIGFLLTLTFFKYFGERLGFNYDEWSENSWYDDWESNADAYLAFSTLWFVVMPMMTVVGIVVLLRKLSKWYLKL